MNNFLKSHCTIICCLLLIMVASANEFDAEIDGIWNSELPGVQLEDVDFKYLCQFIEKESMSLNPEGKGVKIILLNDREYDNKKGTGFYWSTTNKVSLLQFLEINARLINVEYVVKGKTAFLMPSALTLVGHTILKGKCINASNGEPIQQMQIQMVDELFSTATTAISQNGDFLSIIERPWLAGDDSYTPNLFIKASHYLKQNPLSFIIKADGYKNKRLDIEENEINYLGINEINVHLEPIALTDQQLSENVPVQRSSEGGLDGKLEQKTQVND